MLKITATDLPRFLQCSGHIHLDCEKPLHKENKVKDEGNAAHWVVEQVIKNGMSVDELIDRQAPNGIHIDHTMIDYLFVYLEECQDASIEETVNFQLANVEVGARIDCVKIVERNIIISDLKYGFRIVEPHDNWTMSAYAIGMALKTNWDFDSIVLKIHQPRTYHRDGTVRWVTMSRDDVVKLYEELELKLYEAIASNTLNTGLNCHYCPKAHVCPAARNAGMNVVEMSTETYTDNLDDHTLSFTLDQVNRAYDQIKDLRDAYTDEAFARVKKGKIIDNYFIESGRSRVDWRKDTSLEFVKMMAGKLPVVKESLVTPLQAKSLGLDELLVDSLSQRNEGSQKLVRCDASQKAKKVFEQK